MKYLFIGIIKKTIMQIKIIIVYIIKFVCINHEKNNEMAYVADNNVIVDVEFLRTVSTNQVEYLSCR